MHVLLVLFSLSMLLSGKSGSGSRRHALSSKHDAREQVIKANDDLTPDHHQFFLYQLLRGLKFVHSGKLCSALFDLDMGT